MQQRFSASESSALAKTSIRRRASVVNVPQCAVLRLDLCTDGSQMGHRSIGDNIGLNL
jgi:hypothetical protein